MGPGTALLAADAYVYGSPLVRELCAVQAGLQEGFGVLGPAPFNDFAHAEGPATPAAHVPWGASDLVEALAQLDLSGGPVRLHVPDTGGAYYVLQFVDTWSNSFTYLGSRATGTGEGEWLVVPPGWSGTVPDGVAGVIDAPTSVVSLVGRIACADPRDLPRVRALQQELTLTHLGARAHRTGLPAPDPDVPEALRFFEQLRVWAADFPPAAPDRAYQDRFQPLGLLEEGPSPYVSAGPGLVRALGEGLALGRSRVEEAVRSQEAAHGPPGAWEVRPHPGDRGLDHHGVGTIGPSEWQTADREASYLVRAVAAREALWTPHGYEAVYAHTAHDSRGRPLDGAHRYVLRLAEPPPVRAFWSVTMYDTPGHHLVANPVDRYAIGDHTPGLVHDADGSLTLHLSADPPADPARAANWLPAPAGGFGPLMRLHLPEQAVLDGTYVIPAVERVEGV
ncbi:MULTISPECIES: DUF1254 domain-containing protein [Streptomyces]|uniref:DUF1254 domain-containing protein n=1 Tax=Streptomyces TaxID=1883 RepID=UPI0029BA6A3C|nr:DUF1254 domain-containing protein [Streptomyces sp. ND04-05B]MDX3061385.1 DUF1254 domain-containing protein [Streptomyces sp. ND04-05B]